MKIHYELTLTESIMVLNALTQYAVCIENENEKKLVEKVKHGLRTTAANAIKAQIKLEDKVKAGDDIAIALHNHLNDSVMGLMDRINRI